MTASQSVYIHGGLFVADFATFTFADTDEEMLVTFSYPQVTITSLSASETLTFVCFPTFHL
jgi:hypothetical protein